MEHTNMILRLLRSSLFLSYVIFYLNYIESVTTVTAAANPGFTNETDRHALLDIKGLIPGDPFRVFSSWNDSHHFCNWQGVTCSRRHQRVTVLNLSSLTMVGSLSPYIGNLTFLKAIDLRNNSFHAAIPQEVNQLFRLQHLLLSNNSFQGELPTNLTHCLHLRVIGVDRNNLRGKIPIDLSSLSNLYRLDLSRNNFTGTIPPSLGNLSTLRVLSLAGNNLEGSIPFELGWLSNLEFFHLAYNNLSGTVPTQLYNISSIYFFSVAFNRIHGRLPPNLGLTLPKLQMFFVGKNQFSGPIPASIANSSGLVDFDIAFNSFIGPVPSNLGILQGLQILNFGSNQLGTKEANDFTFLGSLTNCTNLRFLSLYQNHLRGVFPSSIANLSTNLMTLWLGGNYISGSIPPGIGNLINLELLALHDNMLTGSIPDSIGKLSKLRILGIYINKISGKIPPSIGNITLLSFLYLEQNLLEGSIPVSLGNCTKLQVLSLSQNRLTGPIPEQVIGLSSPLSVLLLNQNYLVGALPSQVGVLKNLEVLHISENKLSGKIPSTLGNCLTLQGLDMTGNFFEGTIPSSFRQLRGIQYLNLSRNNLSGQIPSFIGEFSFLGYLNLSFNNFEGEVPNEGIFTNISAFSVLGNKMLCGGIKPLQLPACPAEVSKREGKPFTHRLIILVISVGLFIILLLACICAIFYRSRSSKSKPSSATPLENQYPKLSYAELLQATDGFSAMNLIGEGRYGSVYKGTLICDEQIIAVKVLNLQQRGANKSFMAECEALRNIRHRNLVKIITSCSSIDFKGNNFKALVFEFMPKGSLESWLHPSSSGHQHSQNVNLVQRLNIAIDVASALDYLHHHCETPMVHCDLKPSNVLLDDVLSAHVGDFGLARFLLATTGKSIHAQTSSIGIRGTIGYVAPEYGMGGEVSTHGDVYSYGILLMEMFTGRRPTESMFTDNFNLHNFAKMALPDRILGIVDPLLTLEEEDDSNSTNQSSRGNIAKVEECLASILQIGVKCSADLPRERMDIRDVLMELHVIRSVFLGVGSRQRERERERERLK